MREFKQSHRGGIGLVLRDSRRQFVAARNMPLEGITDPLIAEAIAAREGLIFASFLEVENLLVEGDSMNLIHMIKREVNVDNSVEFIVEDIRRMACNFVSCAFVFSKRDTNGVAHCLTCKGFGGVGLSIWESLSV